MTNRKPLCLLIWCCLGIRLEDLSRWRILRKSLDARRKDSLQFVYTIEVCCPDEEARMIARAGKHPGDIQIGHYDEPPFLMPAPGDRPLEHAPWSSVPVPAVWWRPISWPSRLSAAGAGARPSGARAHPRRPRLRRRRPARSGEQLPLRRRRRRHLQRRQADLPRLRPGRAPRPGSCSPSARASRRSSTMHRPHLGSNRLPAVVKAIRRRIEALGGEVRFSCRVEDLDIARRPAARA